MDKKEPKITVLKPMYALGYRELKNLPDDLPTSREKNSFVYGKLKSEVENGNQKKEKKGR